MAILSNSIAQFKTVPYLWYMIKGYILEEPVFDHFVRFL
ncbi:hypothetical protein M090_4648 [Parabacteroides distasonis str. 3776 Po2 i]|uniref:Uncharacterized protein n=1 Tax=Parabacteroides distasonis str. 3776 D15 i TaxID=1339342 RepID=A0AB34L8P6_PARDI|nr:hypothetical protein M091_0042 [Parabacteroides distasonis str. 3776 D15 i]KDS41548.1 hypothetical protein M091_3395 [Parabacteroides distasonis str. 3776 D15 i]KDS43855.1 hypothetical protein M090_4648 [Parabacteroides distasonis str. 3776 Po2 i]